MTDDLSDSRVAVDTAVFIYFIEEDRRFAPAVEPLFAGADRGTLSLVTSAITLLEVLVVPYRIGNWRLADRYEALLARSRGVELIDLTRSQLRAAAQIRATTGVKTPDSLQLAAALSAECTTFVTNDRRLPTVPRLRILQLSDYAA